MSTVPDIQVSLNIAIIFQKCKIKLILAVLLLATRLTKTITDASSHFQLRIELL